MEKLEGQGGAIGRLEREGKQRFRTGIGARSIFNHILSSI